MKSSERRMHRPPLSEANVASPNAAPGKERKRPHGTDPVRNAFDLLGQIPGVREPLQGS